MTFSVDEHEWKRLSHVAFSRGRWGRIGIILAIAIVAASWVITLVARSLVLSGVGGWNEPETEAVSFSAIILVVGAGLAIVALRQTWYKANGHVGMLLDQLVEVDSACTLRYSFRVRGDIHLNGRNIIVTSLARDITQVTYDPTFGLITLRGTLWHGLNPDISQGMALPDEAYVTQSYVVIPNCFSPNLLEYLSQRFAIQTAPTA